MIAAYAKAFEIIPRQLSQNAGFDSTDVVNELRKQHAQGATWAGVDIENEGVFDAFKGLVWEPTLVRQSAIAAATEADCIILSVDETVRNAKSEGVPEGGMMPPGAGRGMRR